MPRRARSFSAATAATAARAARRAALAAACVASVASVASVGSVGCRDVSRFSSRGDHFEGAITAGEFVRTGLTSSVKLCLLVDGDHLQDAPGTISTSDGLFASTRLRPIPQLWHDPLSTMTFGEGRVQSLVYMAMPATTDDSGVAATDVTVILSLLRSGDVEARLLRSAPPPADAVGAGLGASGLAPSSLSNAPLFGVFALARRTGPCSF